MLSAGSAVLSPNTWGTGGRGEQGDRANTSGVLATVMFPWPVEFPDPISRRKPRSHRAAALPPFSAASASHRGNRLFDWPC
jgi:hypothetical protein